MNKFYFYFYFYFCFCFQVTANAGQACDPEEVLAKVYTGIQNSFCLGAVGSPSVSLPISRKCLRSFAAVGGLVTVSAKLDQWEINKKYGNISDFDRHLNTEQDRLRRRKELSTMKKSFKSNSSLTDYYKAREELKLLTKNPNRSVGYVWNMFDETYDAVLGSPNKRLMGSRVLKGADLLFARPLLLLGGAGLALEVASNLLSAKSGGCGEEIYNYVESTPDCKLVPVLGPNTSRFLDFKKEKQMDIMRRIPDLCFYYQKLGNQMNSSFKKIAVSKYDVKACYSDGRPMRAELKWGDGKTAKLKFTPEGDIRFTSNHNSTKSYLLNLIHSKNKQPRMASMQVARKGFAERVVRPASVLQKDIKALGRRGSPLLNEDQADLALGMRVHFGAEMLKEKVGRQCSKLLKSDSLSPPSDILPDENQERRRAGSLRVE